MHYMPFFLNRGISVNSVPRLSSRIHRGRSAAAFFRISAVFRVVPGILKLCRTTKSVVLKLHIARDVHFLSTDGTETGTVQQNRRCPLCFLRFEKIAHRVYTVK